MEEIDDVAFPKTVTVQPSEVHVGQVWRRIGPNHGAAVRGTEYTVSAAGVYSGMFAGVSGSFSPVGNPGWEFVRQSPVDVPF